MIGEHDGFREAHKHVGHEDYARMHRTSRTFRNTRWTPPWALDDKKVRMVVYEHVWRYAGSVYTGSRRRRPGMSLKELESLCAVARQSFAERIPESAPRQAHVLSEHVRTTEQGIAAQAVQLIYKAYRERLRGTDIADLMHMSHDAVRVHLYRLNLIARRLFPQDCSVPHWTAKPDRKKKPSPPQVAARLTPKIQALADQYNAGATLAELSKSTGIPISTISWYMRTSGVVTPERRKEKKGWFQRKVTTDQMNEIVFFHAAGTRTFELARIFGCNANTLRAYLHRRRNQCQNS